MKHKLPVLVAMLVCISVHSTEMWLLSSRGYGNVKAGMSIVQAELALGTKLHTYEARPLDLDCDYVSPARGHEGISMMVERGRVTHILASSSHVQTISGVRVGSTTSVLKKVFGEQLEIEPHKYDDEGFYYFVWEKNRQYGVKFEIAGDSVVSILAGDKTIMRVEGCS